MFLKKKNNKGMFILCIESNKSMHTKQLSYLWDKLRIVSVYI